MDQSLLPLADKVGRAGGAEAPAKGHRRDRRRGVLAGGLAALVALAVAVLLGGVTGAVSFLDAAAETILDLMPLRLFSALLDLFGTSAKGWLLAGLLAAFAVGGMVGGRIFARTTAGSRRIEWVRGLAYAAIAWVALAILLLWRYGGETGGPLAGARPLGVLFALTIATILFGLVLAVVLSFMRRLDPAPLSAAPVLARRRLLTWAALGVAGVASFAILGREVSRVRTGSRVGQEPSGRLADPITPNDDFYVVSKNFRDPDPDRDGDWAVEVGGAVQRPGTFDQAELAALAGSRPHHFVSTLTCISNPVGGPLISTAEWTGVPLANLLSVVGVSDDAIDVVFHGRDGYADSIPLAKALAPETALVWAMNGEVLPRSHGYPVRAIVPGRYGIKNVKWIERITLEPRDVQGYWQQRGWTDDGTVKTMSRIDVPANKGIVTVGDAASSGVAGIAFAGDRDIARVEVSLDDGETWQDAGIINRPGSLAWVLWRYDWLPSAGTVRVSVRATDGTGALQSSERVDPLPDGASGWHEVAAGVVD